VAYGGSQTMTIKKQLGLKSYEEWLNYCASRQKPDDIPSNPNQVYENEWEGTPEWLGYEESTWSIRRVKELLQDLINSKIIYQWDEAVLYSFFIRKGLLNLYADNRHARFFKDLIAAARTKQGYETIEEYANSDSEVPPDLSKFKAAGTQQDNYHIHVLRSLLFRSVVS
jgi:hypothetical protein